MIRRIINKIRGSQDLNYAIRRGLKCGICCTDMGKCDFGSEPYLIKLGDYVRISDHVQFITHDGGSWVFRRNGRYKDVVRFGRIHVGNNVFLGSHSIIMPDVVIGDNVVIGAGAVVTGNIPSNSVAVGLPAKVVMTIDEYAEKMKKRMPQEWNMEELKKNKREYLERMLFEP